MLSATLDEVAAWLRTPAPATGVTFTGVSIDTRTLVGGNLFVALAGERVDAHALVGEAAERGAAAVLVEREVDCPVPRLVVPSTRRALAALGAFARERYQGPVVGITGSNGKTTVKEMTAAILGCVGPTHATSGNLNNDIGVPLTLCRLSPAARAAVIEMGANHIGEIAMLGTLVRPTVAAVTLCAPAHIEGFGSIEGVARAKCEIYESLGPQGHAVLNADDVWAPFWRERIGARPLTTFGRREPADVRAEQLSLGAEGSQFLLVAPQGRAEVRLALPGEHAVANALCAAALAYAAGAGPEHVAEGLAAVRPVKGRLQRRPGRGGLVVIDDAYNANPGSLAAALRYVATLGGERWLALGDMAELGDGAIEAHREAGSLARTLGFSRLYGAGPLSAHAVQAFGDGGTACADVDALATLLGDGPGAPVVLLVKGSRAARMDRLVARLVPED